LELRRILRQALRHVTESTVPFIHQTIGLTWSHTHDLAKSTGPEFAPLDLLAGDCGIDIGESDHSMKQALREFKNQPTDPSLWALLPELYGIGMSATKWRFAKYSIQYEGHTNNAHVVASAIYALIATFNGISGATTEGGPAVDARIHNDLERFVHCAAYTLLHHAIIAKHPPLIQDSMMFLEQFISKSGGRLYLSILEECFPFTLIRTNFIRIYEQQTAKGRRYALATDDEKEAA